MNKGRNWLLDECKSKLSSKCQMMDKAKALKTARSPSCSKYGNALLTNNVQEGRILSSEVARLERQHKRQQMHLDQAQKRFLQRQNQRPGPTLILERPPSPEQVKRFLYCTKETPYTHSTSEPSYMNNVKSKVKVPLMQPTIDAFVVKVKKKRNVWEEAMIEKQPAMFASTVQPCWPLTPAEQAELRVCLECHERPRSSIPGKAPAKNSALPPVRVKSAGTISRMNTAIQSPESPEMKDMTFITQMKAWNLICRGIMRIMKMKH